MRYSNIRYGFIASLVIVLLILLSPLCVFAKDLPLFEVKEVAAKVIPALLDANGISVESNEFEIKGYIPEYIYSTNGLVERSIIHFPIYSGENIVAKIVAIYDSSRGEYSFCSSISSVELLNNSRQYMTKGLFIDIGDDCFYTDGNVFISTSSGETKGIDDFDLTCQNVSFLHLIGKVFL